MSATQGGTVVDVRNLSKSYGEVIAVSGIDFTVAAGETVALLGGNGAGKTTTLSILLGLLVPSAGDVSVFGEDIVRHRHRVLPRMNFSSPYVDLPKRLSGWENLVVYGNLYGLTRVKARVARVADDLRMGEFLHRPLRTLSAGQMTRVSIAKALLNEPDLLLLDEPTASLDPDTADWVREFFENYRRRTGAAILLASHNMGEVERLCDRVLMMRRGRIVDEGSPSDLIRRYGRRNLEEVFLDIVRDRGVASESPNAEESR